MFSPARSLANLVCNVITALSTLDCIDFLYLLFYQQLRKNNQLGYIVNDGLQEGSKMGTNVDKNKQKNVSPSTTTNLYEGSKKEEIAKLSRKK